VIGKAIGMKLLLEPTVDSVAEAVHCGDVFWRRSEGESAEQVEDTLIGVEPTDAGRLTADLGGLTESGWGAIASGGLPQLSGRRIQACDFSLGKKGENQGKELQVVQWALVF